MSSGFLPISENVPNLNQRGHLCLESDISASYAGVVFHEGDVLRKWREAREWTVVALAAKAGVDKNTVSRVERGEPTRTDTLRDIVAALGHTLEELHRALNHPGELQPGEMEFLTRWRRLSEEARSRISGVVRLAEDYEGRVRQTSERETAPAHLPRVSHPSEASRTPRGRAKRGK